MRAVARALAAFHVAAELCGNDAAAAPFTLAKRLRAYADALEPRPDAPGTAADLERLFAEQQRFLITAIETLLERVGAERVRCIHGRIDCRSVWVRQLRAVRLAKADPRACGDVAEDVASLAIDLRARHFLPMHWGTFDLTDEPIDEAPRELRRVLAREGADPDRVRLLAVGETWALPDAPASEARSPGD